MKSININEIDLSHQFQCISVRPKLSLKKNFRW